MVRSIQLPSRRYGILAACCLILVLQASASRLLKIDEASIGIPGLHNLPWRIGTWQTFSEGSIGDEVAAYLKPDEYILRDYVDQRNSTVTSLFVAYFKSLQNTYGPHSPRICLPGSGWLVKTEAIKMVPVPGRPQGIPVNEFLMEKADSRILVFYWYQNDRDTWAQEFHAKLRLLPDLIRYRRSDVSLVRLVTTLRGQAVGNELDESVEFTQLIYPMLAQHFSSVSTERP
jgi:EpsI family protein